MKVSQMASYRTMRHHLDRVSSSLFKLQVSTATGKKVMRPSDDPPIVRPLLDSKTELIKNERFTDNMDSAMGHLQIQDRFLAQADNLLVRAKEININGLNGSMTKADHDILRREVLQIKDDILAIANANVNGQYLFAGYEDQTEPFAWNPDYPALSSEPVIYSGDDGIQQIGISPSQKVALNVPGSEAFLGTVGYGGIPGTGQTRLGLAATTTDIDGQLSVNSTPIAVAGAGTYNQNSAKEIVAGATAAGFTAVVSAEATFNAGMTNRPGADLVIGAGELVINGVDLAGTIAVGADQAAWETNLLNHINTALNPEGVNATLVNGELNFTATDGSNIQIQNGGDLSASFATAFDGTLPDQTVFGSVAITDEGALVDTALPGADYGVEFPIGSSSSMNVFKALAKLEEGLKMSDQSMMEEAVGDIEKAAEQLRRVRSELGNTASSIEVAYDHMESARVDLQEIISGYEDVDIVEAISEMTRQEMALQAALNMTMRINQSSILDYLR